MTALWHFYCKSFIFCFVGQLFDSATVKGLTGSLFVDPGARRYKFDAKIQVDITKERMKFTPVVSLEIPDWKNVQISGEMNVVVKKEFESFESDLDITGMTKNPIKFQSKLPEYSKFIMKDLPFIVTPTKSLFNWQQYKDPFLEKKQC